MISDTPENTRHSKAQTYLDAHCEVEKQRKIMELAGRDLETATDAFDTARRNLGAIVGTATPDRLFLLDCGMYVDVHFKELGKFTITMREVEIKE